MDGYVNIFVKNKGYGFIKGSDDNEYFFHLEDFSDPKQVASIAVGERARFVPVMSPNGYKAQSCLLVTPSDDDPCVLPETVLLSKTGKVPGWEVVERGDWILAETSRVSVDDAVHALTERARVVGANAIIDITYSRSAAPADGKGEGDGQFRHHFRGRIATAARRTFTGKRKIGDLTGLNKQAESIHAQLLKIRQQQDRSVINAHLGRAVFILACALLFYFHYEGTAILGLLAYALIRKKSGGSSYTNTYWLQPDES